MPEIFRIEDIVFSLERKAIKHMYLRVKPDFISVSAPVKMPFSRIRQFAVDHLGWVRQKLAAVQAIPERQEDAMRVQHVWGEIFSVRFAKAKNYWLELAGGELIGHMPATPDAATWQAILNSWHKMLVEKEAAPLLEKWSQRLNLDNVQMSSRLMKRRWGTCYPGKGKIFLNSQLATKPRNCLEYVITHELLHFYHPGHGEDFKKAMACHWPNWREMDAALDGKN